MLGSTLSSAIASMTVPSTSRPFEVLPAAPRSVRDATPPLYRVKTPSHRIAIVLSARAEGLDPSAAERVFGFRQVTITSLSGSYWRARAALTRTLLPPSPPAPCRVLCKAEALLRGPAEFPFFLERRKLCLSPSTSLSHRPERFNLAVIVLHRAGAGGVSSACTPTRCQRRAGLAQTSHARRTGRVPKAPRGGMYAHAPGLSQWALHPRSGNPYRAH
jgi:hypothetical protein